MKRQFNLQRIIAKETRKALDNIKILQGELEEIRKKEDNIAIESRDELLGFLSELEEARKSYKIILTPPEMTPLPDNSIDHLKTTVKTDSLTGTTRTSPGIMDNYPEFLGDTLPEIEEPTGLITYLKNFLNLLITANTRAGCSIGYGIWFCLKTGYFCGRDVVLMFPKETIPVIGGVLATYWFKDEIKSIITLMSASGAVAQFMPNIIRGLLKSFPTDFDDTNVNRADNELKRQTEKLNKLAENLAEEDIRVTEDLNKFAAEDRRVTEELNKLAAEDRRATAELERLTATSKLNTAKTKANTSYMTMMLNAMQYGSAALAITNQIYSYRQTLLGN